MLESGDIFCRFLKLFTNTELMCSMSYNIPVKFAHFSLYSGEFSDNDTTTKCSNQPSDSAVPCRLTSWLSWRPTSIFHLTCCERRLLDQLNCHQEDKMVTLASHPQPFWSHRVVPFLRTLICRSRTPSANYDNRLPLVLLHGMGAGVGLWMRNFDAFAEQRRVVAMDLLGFGRSSRVTFAQDPSQAEAQIVDSIETWRREMHLDKFVLLGHSLGGFLAYSYALRYPDRVAHLILADPWGFPEKPPDAFDNINRVFLTVARVATYFNPLSVIRVAGPFGPGLVRRFRADISSAFAPALPHDESHLITDYLYHANAQNPSGETAFKALSSDLGYARNPMVRRAAALDDVLPVTFVYGGRSWMDSQASEMVQSLRGSAATDVHIISGAGHHLYAQRALQFNALVNRVCARADVAQGVARPDVTEASMQAQLEEAEFLEKDLPEARTRRRRPKQPPQASSTSGSSSTKRSWSSSDSGGVSTGHPSEAVITTPVIEDDRD